jgi:UDP-N-acetylmuramoyl-tripeptide--D-alanyl-D-alanine ligase
MSIVHAPLTVAPSSFWTLARVADALGAGFGDDRAVRAVCTDTRSVFVGDLFVALKGETFDAHDFLAEAATKGAIALVVNDASRAAGLGVPVYEVRDTLGALGALARYRRRAWGKPVIAVGGSNGKTSTKELLRAALGARLDVHATQGNLNNQIGVPLTLLALPNDADIAVIELGTSMSGEIALLRDIVEANIAIITTVQEEHLEGLGDLAGVMAEEASLLDGVSTAIVPASEHELVVESKGRAHRTVTAGLSAGDVNASAHGMNPDGSGWLSIGGVRIDVPLRGAHNLRNAMLAVAAAAECGISAADAGAAIAAIDLASLPSMRSSVTPLGQALLINDAYNSNPGSARAAIQLLTDVGVGRQRVIVLGTMRELGASAERSHREIAAVALASGADVIAGIGEFGPALQAIGAGDARIVTANDVDDVWPRLAPRLKPNAAILLKASRGVRLERMLPLLNAWAGVAPATPV